MGSNVPSNDNACARVAPTLANTAHLKTPELLEAIARDIANGATMKQVCNQPGRPEKSTVWHWMQHDPDFRAAMDEAIRQRTELFAEEAVSLTDEEPPVGHLDGKVDSGWVAWRKMQVASRQWAASKLLPKKYGDKLTVETVEENLTVEEMERKIAQLLRKQAGDIL